MGYHKKNDPLAEARKALGLTQVELAERSGVSQSVISSFEGGHTPESVVSALRLAQTLGQPVETLFGHMLPPKRTQTGARRPAKRKAA